MTLAHVKCTVCGGFMEPQAITADGESWACECGRTRMTSLLGGKLELGLVTDEQLRTQATDYDPRIDWPERYKDGPI